MYVKDFLHGKITDYYGIFKQSYVPLLDPDFIKFQQE